MAIDDKILPENNMKLEFEAPIKIHPNAMKGANTNIVNRLPNFPDKIPPIGAKSIKANISRDANQDP